MYLISKYRYDAIVFDFDGTLIDSADIKTLAFAKLYEPYGEEIVHKVLMWHKQHQGVSRFVKFRHWQENILGQPYSDELGAQLSKQFSKLVFNAVVQAPLIEGVLAFLEQYHQQIPLYIASATPESELLDIVRQREMAVYFQGVYGAPAIKKDILLQIIQENQWVAQRVLMVGDSISDWEGANAVGAQFLGVAARENNSLPISCMTIKNFKKWSLCVEP